MMKKLGTSISDMYTQNMIVCFQMCSHYFVNTSFGLFSLYFTLQLVWISCYPVTYAHTSTFKDIEAIFDEVNIIVKVEFINPFTPVGKPHIL